MEEFTPLVKAKKLGDAMKHVLPRMPAVFAEIALYFGAVENALEVSELRKGFG